LSTVHKELFHWDVALVQSAPTTHEPIQTADVSHPTAAKSPDRTHTASHTTHTIRHAAPSVEHIAALGPKTESRISPKPILDGPSPVASPSEGAATSIPNEVPPSLRQATEPPGHQTAPPISPTAQEPQVSETIAAAATLEESRPPADTTQPAPSPPTVSDTAAPSAIHSDYGWLQQAIFRRLEELKRSSRPSLDESRPLKVTVKAVVSREGILLDSAVVKSSGLDHIDQEAMALVQRAFPMQLDRPLDRGQIAMRIPIAYSRE